LRDVVTVAAASLLLAVASVAFVVVEVGDPSQEPGALAVLAVVAAGICLTLFAFHALRIRAALRFGRKQLPEALLRAHLAPGTATGSLVGPIPSAYHAADPARSTPASPREEE
jgi:hypothetical protein